MEFGYELISVIPYAYSLHKKGLLEGTISGTGSEPLYTFSPDHKINPAPRDFANTAATAKRIPNVWIHKDRLNKDEWAPPPYKQMYRDVAMMFEKPTVVIYNRYNREWDKDPINYFDLPTLRSMFSMLRDEYSIVYFNVRGEEGLEDNAHSMELGDYEMIREEFPDVHIIHDIIKETGLSYNEAQMRIFAGCDRFVTMNGGPAILASYFGGENIIYTKECRELGKTVNSFYNWYPDFGNSLIKVVHTYDDLLAIVKSKWVDKDPLINVLVRCHRRKKGLERLMDSIKSQKYVNWNVITSYQDEETWRYLRSHPTRKLRVSPIEKPATCPTGYEYRGFFAPNLYLNEMAELVPHGIITYMDDDDYYQDDGAFSVMAYRTDKKRIHIWRAQRESGGSVIPSDENWRNVVAGDISGIALCFWKQDMHDVKWGPWRRGDYRFIRDLKKLAFMDYLFTDRPMSVIGKRIDQKKSAEESRKAREARAEALNASVRAKLAARAAAAPPVKKVSRTVSVCPCCQRPL